MKNITTGNTIDKNNNILKYWALANAIVYFIITYFCKKPNGETTSYILSVWAFSWISMVPFSIFLLRSVKRDTTNHPVVRIIGLVCGGIALLACSIGPVLLYLVAKNYL
jgi:cytochrome bd-type quinol oxidase subunit 2